jgi:FtsP/CotA-like multicopper oxidase with cupredoxin domain
VNRRDFILGSTAATLGATARANAAYSRLDLSSRKEQSQESRYKLRIAPLKLDLGTGVEVKTIGYNGIVPGPLLRLEEGRPVSIDVFNETDVPELVHWHGLAIDPLNDGAMEEGSPMIPPGGQRRYNFTPRPAGSRWYHSHAAAGADLTRATYSGQFGFLYIEPKANTGAYDHEIFLAVHHWDPMLAHTGPHKTCEVSYRHASFNDKMLHAAEPLRVHQGQRVLFHFLNASATENVELALPGHQLHVIALDGNPVPVPSAVNTISLGVAERVDAIVEMNSPGVWILGSTSESERSIGLGLPIEYAGKRGEAQWIDPGKSDWSYLSFGNRKVHPVPEETFPMVFQKVIDDSTDTERWTINGRSFPNIPPLKVKSGNRYRLAFYDASGDSHPVHLHRHSFELVSVNGVATSGIVKDTVRLDPYGSIEVDFVAENPGPTLFHCHQQLHMDAGFIQLIQYV